MKAVLTPPAPTLRKGDVVIMDNSPARKFKGSEDRRESVTGAARRKYYCPPSSVLRPRPPIRTPRP
jgi:hypothetical protein